jgi:hypothetical protein
MAPIASKRKSRKPRSEPANEGQRLLLKAARHSSLAEVARAVGCRSRENCRSWLHGTKTPNSSSRTKLQRAFAIPRTAWDLLPVGHPSRSVNALNEDQALAQRTRKSSGSTLDDCIALLDDVSARRQQPGLLLKDQIAYAKCETRILALRARLERDVELSEDRYVRQHPGWLRLRNIIFDVLRPYPEILKQLGEAIEYSTPHASDERGGVAV